jgi:hypothetical protein
MIVDTSYGMQVLLAHKRVIKCNSPTEFCREPLHTHMGDLKSSASELAHVVNVAEDKIFGAFCRKIKLSHIREYEERQLKASQEESEGQTEIRYADCPLDTPVWPSVTFLLMLLLICWSVRTKFEQDSLKSTKPY